jgi:cytochrome c551/c552
MGFLDSLVLPVSGEHLNLLNFLLLCATLMFTIYTGVLFGSIFISTWYRRRGITRGSKFAERFSRDIVDVITTNPTMWFGFGLMPLLAVAFIMIQLTHSTGVATPSMLLVLLPIYGFALLASYFYRHSFLFSDLYDAFKGQRNKKEDFRTKSASKYHHSMKGVNETTAFWSLSLLMISMWIFTTAMHAAKNPDFFDKTAINIIFSWGGMLKTIYFYFASLAVGAGTFLYVRFIWDGGEKYEDQNYASQAKKVASGFGLVGLIIQPVFFGLGLVFNSAEAYSVMSFSAAVAGVILAFVVSHQLYSIIRLNDVGFIKLGYWVLILGFSAFVMSDHFGFTSSNEQNRLAMAHHFEELELARAAEASGPAPVDAANIYETRCSACHKFDVAQVTAPAYTDAIPKYEGSVEDLADFIQNPVPRGNIDPNGNRYPMMANQGLTKREATAMAEWILQELKNYE